MYLGPTMKRSAMVLGLVSVLGLNAPVFADAVVGQMAPTFTATDSNGKTHSLGDFKGKYVVLEWTNYDCPFVKRQYNLTAMQTVQKGSTQKGVVWLSINSSAPGKQGNFTTEEINRRMKDNAALPTAYLVDPEGKVGRLYAAKTTPHMFIIDPTGKLVYDGAIDDKPTADPSVPVGSNYVTAALGETMAGKPVTVATTKPYGCSVKY